MGIELRREDFLSQYPPLYHLNRQEVKDIWQKEEIHLYVHFPYCIKRCDFCYYKSFQAGQNGIPDSYIQLLKKEIKLYSKMPEVQNKIVRSIYFGGGSPNLLTEKQFIDITTFIYEHFNMWKEVEFTCEMSPMGETSVEKMKLFKELGVKRLSIGCQSLNDRVLTVNGRNHSSEEFYRCFYNAREADIYSINVDNMSGLVDQSMEDWLETIDKICELKPENVAVYKLEIYLNNKLYFKYRNGDISLISDEEETEYARIGFQKLLDNGYKFADNFSFFTEDKYDHIHRRNVWLGDDMLGVGLSAHSCFNQYIYQNTSRINEYKQFVENDELPIFRAHRISLKEEMIQRIIFGIKNLKFSRVNFEEEFGIDPVKLYEDKFKSLETQGFIKINPKDVETTFEGALFADDIVREFFLEEHKTSMLAHVRRA